MPSWSDPLVKLARENLPPDVAEAWETVYRPAVRLTTGGAGARAGQLGGSPELPAGAEWPRWRGELPMNFVASVDCAALPRVPGGIELPAGGSLLFFYCDDWFEAEGPVDLTSLGAVLGVPAGAETAERTAPEGVEAYPRLDLSANVTGTFPGSEHEVLRRTLARDGRPLTDPDNWSEEFFDLLRESAVAPYHQIGGCSWPVQGPPEDEVALAVLPDGSEDSAYADEALRWVLLAQIDSDGDAGMTWGDVGILYWLIRDDDLAAGRFDRVRCVMQSG
ncbi:YwqG family protein [Amycolatopsis benzoatilytica]|uniref:YwqG family protein n=1 Tax=Amycolatopsis benzoatilytica TaxID=346045 RepID=UPI0003742B27|nr:YwqG family protein [Amycolatopsis benzoatilytica]